MGAKGCGGTEGQCSLVCEILENPESNFTIPCLGLMLKLLLVLLQLLQEETYHCAEYWCGCDEFGFNLLNLCAP